MKQTLLVLLAAATLITSCSKTSSITTTKSTPTVLLTNITDNTTGDAGYGKPLAEFTYNGKQLTKAVLYSYSVTTDVETDLFNYNSQGQLTGTTISHSQPNSYDDVSSTVAYNGSNISEIKFYTAGNVLDRDIKLTYQGSNLINWLNTNEVSETYSYDANGNNIKQVGAEYQNGKADGYQYTTTNSTFDSKSNLSQALPLWVYFRVYNEGQFLTYTSGAHNPINANDNGTAFTYSYQYNSNGYPSAISWSDQYAQSYTYTYTQVN